MTCYEVAVAAPLFQTLTYAAPEDGGVSPIIPGVRVLVPLGGRTVTGYLLGAAGDLPDDPSVLKPILEVVDETPLFPETLIPFYRWIASYYQYPIGEVIKTALPGGLTAASRRRILLTARGKDFFGGIPPYPWAENLIVKGELTAAATRKLWRTELRRVCEKWQKEELVSIVEEVSRGAVRSRTETCIALAESREFALLTPSERKSCSILSDLLGDEKNHGVVPRRQLIEIYPGAGRALKGLAAKGVIILSERAVYRDPFGETPPGIHRAVTLTEEQQAVMDKVLPSLDSRKFNPFLLHGVTGSGKTEIYLRAAAATLGNSRSVLVLVPEIALASHLEGQFVARFGERVALLHSGLSSGERFDQWMRIVRGDADVVIGARSALFAPLRDPGLIIVDEEHESAYKQEDGFRYHGRDLAVLRASQQNSVVILGSATPSVSSFYHTETGKYRLLTLTKRIENRPLPEIEMVDLRKIPTVSGAPPLFSPQLVAALKETLAASEQSLLFLNRRGYANLMFCRSCGQSIQCPNCRVAMTVHRKRGKLLCHYCSSTRAVTRHCPLCQSDQVAGMGFGTERIEDELKKILPSARTGRLDRDTCANRRDFLAMLKAMHNNEIDVLVGTQIIAKGHHFPRVTLVGIVWADAGLGMPDFRAGERTFQLISQVGGRAGRGERPGRVIIQTHQPDHDSIRLAEKNDFHGLYQQELKLRRGLGYPPFGRLINLRIEGEREDSVIEAAQRIAQAGHDLIKQYKTGRIELLGPAPAPMAMLRGRHRWQVLLKGGDCDSLHRFCAHLVRETKIRDRLVSVSIDVDPENMM